MKPIVPKVANYKVFFIWLLFFSVSGKAQVETIPSGSFIINMGNTNNLTINDDVKPYGMIYDLMKNYNVPIKWVITQGKAKDAADFVHNGITYKGGTFIVPADFRSATVNSRISYWQGQGVVGATSVSAFSAYVYKTLISVPRWTLDAANGGIAQAYLTAAGITLTAFPGAYNWKSPQTLDCCDDFFVMPHADPTWSTHSRLFSWNKDCLGSIWAACHAVSALENSINPSNSSQQMNFLSTRTAAVTPTPWPNNSLKLWGTHSGGSIPYTHRLFDDPVAQYMGVTDLSQLNGSEQIYIPKQSADAGGATRWRPGAKIIAYDPTQVNVPSPDVANGNAAAVIVYGRGFDDPTRGFVMYEAGHSHMKGTSSDGPALRAFLNFSFFQVQPKAPQLGNISGLTSGQNINPSTPVSLSITAGSPLSGITFSYQWSSSVAGGSFSAPTSSSTTYTPPSVGSNTAATITCIVTDNCGRKSFQSVPVTIVPPARPPVTNADAGTIDPGCGSITFTKNVLSNDSDPDGDPIQLTLVNGNAGSFTTANGGLVSFTAGGNITYTNAEGFYGTETLTYTVCDNTTAPCATGTYVITVGNPANIPPATGDAFTIAEDAIGTFNVLANDLPVTNGPYTVYAITSGPSNGKVSVNADNTITYIPNPDFAGTDQIHYRIVNALGYSKSALITVTVTNDACDGGTYQTIAPVSGTVTYNTSIADAAIIYSAALKNWGVSTQLQVRQDNGTQPDRALIYFPLTSIPAGATITNTELRLYRNGGDNNSETIGVYRATRDWNEGTLSNATNTPASNGATWYGSTFSTNWTVPGGDYTTVNGATLTGLTTNSTTYSWDVTTITQNWYNGTNSNYGFLIKDVDEPASNGDKYFASREDGTPANRPTLRVTYTPSGGGGPVTIDIVSTKDTWIEESTLSKVYGNATTFEVDANGPNNSEARLLVKFDVKPADIPVGSTVTSATMKLTRTGGDADAQNIGAYQATNSWNEAAGDNTANTALLNGSTWNHRNYTSLWNTPGGDYTTSGGAVTSVSTSTGGTGGTANYDWNVLSIVQNWVKNSPDPNYGFVVKAVSENVNLQKVFGTRENTTAGNRPTLIVNYTTPPTCGSIPARAPIGNQDTATTISITPVTFNVLNNDHLFSQPATGLTISTAPNAAQGAASANLGAGTITFTPNTTFNGVATFQYTVTTANGSDVVRVYVRVNNSPVVANDDNPAGQNSGTAQTISVLSNDTDPEGAALSVTIITQPVNGTATVNGSNQVIYTPNAGFTGTDVLTYQVCEPSATCGSANCDTATVNLIVLNRAPVSTPDSKTILPCVANTIDLLSNDTDPEGHTLTIFSISALDNPAAGTLVNNNDGTVTFTPTPGYSGTVTFTYTLIDNGVPPMTSATPVLVTIIVNNPPNTTPVAVNDAETINMEQPLFASVRDNDSDPENHNLTIPVITVSPLHGTATVNPLNGLIEYIPNPGFSGTDVLTYQICDEVINQATCTTAPGLCATATLTITVEAPNTVNAVNDENSTWVNTPVSGTTLTNDFDPQGDLPLVFGGFLIGGTAYTSGSHTISGLDATGAPVANAGTLLINADGTYTFTPASNFTGSINVPYVITDSNPNTAADTANLRITINPLPTVNSIIANNDENSTLPNTSVSSTLFTNDKDPQGNTFSVTAFQIDSNGDGIPDVNGNVGNPILVGGITTAGTPVANAGTITINADGTYTFTPAPDFSGSVEMPYTITDALGANSTALLHIDVLADLNGAANDKPHGGDDFVFTDFNTPVTAVFINNDFDPNGNSVSVNGVTINPGGPATAIGGPLTTVQGGTVQFYADGSYTYTPPPGYSGPDRIVYQLCDVTAVNPQPLCTNATIHMLVAPSVIILPVTGLSVSVNLVGNAAVLNWKTESENNTSHFVVERSLDNITYSTVGITAAAGNSNTRNNYTYTDNVAGLLQNEIIFYRIRQVDIDGRSNLSKVVVIHIKKTTALKIWPNPFTTSVSVSITSDMSAVILFRLTDINGKSLVSKQQRVSMGVSQITLDNLDHLANGIYFLEITNMSSGKRDILKLEKTNR